MCECEREIKNFDGEIYGGDDFDTVKLEIIINSLLINLETNEKSSGYLFFKINYCPFCGEKLIGDNCNE